VDTELTLRQREVFVAIVINDVPLDALVTEYAEAMGVLHVYADLVAEGTEAEERYPGIGAPARLRPVQRGLRSPAGGARHHAVNDSS
jgi:hypothetical protein